MPHRLDLGVDAVIPHIEHPMDFVLVVFVDAEPYRKVDPMFWTIAQILD